MKVKRGDPWSRQTIKSCCLSFALLTSYIIIVIPARRRGSESMFSGKASLTMK
jgi:hypothetical protein